MKITQRLSIATEHYSPRLLAKSKDITFLSLFLSSTTNMHSMHVNNVMCILCCSFLLKQASGNKHQ